VVSGIQAKLFELIKHSLREDESMGLVVSDVLSLSTDAVYRRIRQETLMTIEELRKLCIHFDISFDSLMEMKAGSAVFSYLNLKEGQFTVEKYLEGILNGLSRLKSAKDATIYLSVNNVHFFQAFNFPQIIRFRLFFWAKTHLMLPEFKTKRFAHEKISNEAFYMGREILSAYNRIPTTEIVDEEMMHGFLKQVLYYLESNLFEDPSYALFLADRVVMLNDHYMAQAEVGKKFIFGNEQPSAGNELKVYLTGTVNTDSTILYETSKASGVYLTHNIMNYLHTMDEEYVTDSKRILQRQIENSSPLSEVNAKQRIQYFRSMNQLVGKYKQRFEQIINNAQP
jgi:hypothetical protein